MILNVDFSKITSVILNTSSIDKIVFNGVTYWEKIVTSVPTQVWVSSGYYKTENYTQSADSSVHIYNYTYGNTWYFSFFNFDMLVRDLWNNGYHFTNCRYAPGNQDILFTVYWTSSRQVWVDTSHYETQYVSQTVYNFIK